MLFIGGVGRSGSTLLDRVLGQTPGVCSVGELVFLWERGLGANQRCGCGEAFRSCPFWTAVGERAFGGWDRVDVEAMLALKARVDRTRYVPLLLAPWLSRAYAARRRRWTDVLARVYGAIAEVDGAEVIVDSSKHVSTAALLRFVPGFDARIVQLVRDPHGVAWSWAKKVERPDATEGRSLMARVGPARISLRWQAQNLLLAVVRRRGDRGRSPGIAALRYEDVVERPVEATRGLLAAAGLPPAQDLPQFTDERTVALGVDHTVAGNPLRFRTGSVRIRPDTEWRERMPRARRVLVSVLAFPTSVGYGYR